jgi:hypothetical protein
MQTSNNLFCLIKKKLIKKVNNIKNDKLVALKSIKNLNSSNNLE